MKSGEENAPPRILGQSKAIYCFVINQLATPGLGSLMGKRTLAGAGQLTLSVAGFLMLVGWMIRYFSQMVQKEMGETVTSNSHAWMGKWGLICFAASWLWALVTSIGLLRQARREQTAQQREPPRITKPPPEM